MAREHNIKLNRSLLLYKKGLKLINIVKELDIKGELLYKKTNINGVIPDG